MYDLAKIIELYNDKHNTKEKLSYLENFMQKLDNEEEFFQASESLRAKVQEYFLNHLFIDE